MKVEKLSIKNSEYWKYSNKDGGYVRTNDECHIYVKKTLDFICDNMMCNYKELSDIRYIYTPLPRGIRIRKEKEYCVIEPSEIKVPISDIEIINKKDMVKDDKLTNVGTFESSYFCDLISNSIRGGLEFVDRETLIKYRNEIINQKQDGFNPMFLSPSEFVYMFISECHKRGIRYFDTYNLLGRVEYYKVNPEFLPLLWNVKYQIGEHEDTSLELKSAYALLRYIGLIHPAHTKYSLDNLEISDKFDKFPNLAIKSENYRPLMEEFIRTQISSLREYDEKVRKL